MCDVINVIKKHKSIFFVLAIILCLSLIGVFLSGKFFRPSTNDFTGTITAEWKNRKVESDLVRVVNFLENNKGKEIELAGEKQVITGKEKLGIKVVMLECCTKSEFNYLLDDFSKIGLVRGSDFDKKEIQADIPADEIPEIADIWNVERISLEPDAQILWKSILNQMAD